MLAMLLLLAAAPAPVHACGGLFCNRVEPVLQSAERVVFGIGDGQVEMHVQIAFEGSASDFAWIVPVPEVPELLLSTEQLFSVLDEATAPTFLLRRELSGCQDRGGDDDDSYWDCNTAQGDTGCNFYSAPETGVTIVAESQVGPYDTVVLQGDSAEAVLDWLQERDYALPDDLEDTLAPYVSAGSSFVALRLRNGMDLGDLQPLALRYPGTAASIPIQLTAVAATPDMRVHAYVLGDQRAVPLSYLHVEINPMRINWWNDGANYQDVVARAADEAGGHAFATDAVLPTEPLRGRFDVPGPNQLDRLRSETYLDYYLMDVAWLFAPTETLLQVLADNLPIPDGVEPRDFVDCPWCYGYDQGAFDPVTTTDDLERRIVEPLQHAEDLVQSHPWLTRLSSSLDAVEMTVDPTFALNETMTHVIDPVHVAMLRWNCASGRTAPGDAPRRLILDAGRSVAIPSEGWLAARDLHPFDWLMRELDSVAAQRIERTGAGGPAILLVDHTSELRAAERGLLAPAVRTGCAHTSGWPGVAVLLSGLDALGRRSRAQ